MKITLKDGSQLTYTDPKHLYEIAGNISEGLMRAALAAEVDGNVTEMQTMIDHDCTGNFLTSRSKRKRYAASHCIAYFGTGSEKAVSNCKTCHWARD